MTSSLNLVGRAVLAGLALLLGWATTVFLGSTDRAEAVVGGESVNAAAWTVALIEAPTAAGTAVEARFVCSGTLITSRS